MIDLSKVGHKGVWDCVLQRPVVTIWGDDERHGGAVRLIIPIRSV